MFFFLLNSQNVAVRIQPNSRYLRTSFGLDKRFDVIFEPPIFSLEIQYDSKRNEAHHFRP